MTEEDKLEITMCKAMGITDVAEYRAFKAKNGPVGRAPKDEDDTGDEDAAAENMITRSFTPEQREQYRTFKATTEGVNGTPLGRQLGESLESWAARIGDHTRKMAG